MLNLTIINENEDSFRYKLLDAYQQGFYGRDFKKLPKEEDAIFKQIYTLIYECGQYDKKYEDQKTYLNKERWLGNNPTVNKSYIFIGQDCAVNQGIQEFKALVKKQEKGKIFILDGFF